MADIKIIVDSSDVVTADNRIDQLGKSGSVAEKGINKAARGMNQFGTVTKNGGKKLNTFNMQVQQGGYQLQDFVVQLQGGTSFFTAFGQQGSQFAGVFGPQGAVIGAVIAIGSAIGGIGYKALTASSAVKEFEEQLKDTSSVMDDYISLASKADHVFGSLFESSRASLSLTSQASKDLLMIAKTDALDSIRGLGKSLADGSTEAGFWAKVMLNTDKVITGNLLNIDTALRGNLTNWKLTGKEIKSFIDNVRNIGKADSIDGMYESALKARDVFKETVNVTGEMTEKQKDFWKELSTTILKLELMGAASKAAASTWEDVTLDAFGGEGMDVKAFLENLEEQKKSRKDAGLSYFKDEQGIQDAIHQAWVAGNAAQNKLRLDGIKNEKKGRRAAGESYFKQEQANAAAILSQRIKNILAELKAKKDAEVAAMALRRAAGEAYFEQEDDIQDQILQVTVDRIMAEYEARVKAQENAIELRRSAGEAYASDQQQLEDDIHQVIVKRILDEHEAKVKAEKDAIDLRRAAGLKYAREQQDLEDDIHQVRVDNILNEAALRQATISAARAKFSAGADQFGEASQDVLAQRIAELREQWQNRNKKDKVKTPKKDPIADFQKKLDLERELLGVSEARQKVLQALGSDVVAKNPEIVAGMEHQIAVTNELIALEKERQGVIDSVTGSMEDGFMAMIDGTMSVKDAFKQMAADIIKELMRVYVVQKMVSAAKMFFGLPFADGGAFSGGSQIQAYADGGVVGSPTTFPMAGGKTGLMGEAGPEAIMPLKRGANGKLGVQMEGGGGDNISVVQNFSFQANGDDSVKKIIAQAAPQIAQMTKSSLLNDRRRGGATKAAFG